MSYKRISCTKPSTIAIVGVWHQASVLAACFAEMGHHVTGIGDDAAAVKQLSCGRAPVREPRLDTMLSRNLRSGRLRFTADWPEGLRNADFVFLAIDTPVDDRDDPQLETLLGAVQRIAAARASEIVLCVTSQVPLGSTSDFVRLIQAGPHPGACHAAYIPEFLRLGEAVRTFYEADRFVIGADDLHVRERVAALYRPLRRPLALTDLRSAEMIKHASNSFLATSISFINEIADLCERTGADVLEVVRGMKLDRRIGAHAFLSPGLGFSGGTLGRDIRALQRLAEQTGRKTRVLDAVLEVNQSRADRVRARLRELLGRLDQAQIGVLGLTYKPGTSTLRRSLALAIIRGLTAEGACIRAFDPLADMAEANTSLPTFERVATVEQAVEGADALVLVTEWNGIQELDWVRLRQRMNCPILLDTRNHLEPAEMAKAGFQYSGIGRQACMARVATAGQDFDR